MSDLYDDEQPPRKGPQGGSRDAGNEGVRILGAEEARASLGLTDPADTEPADTGREGEAMLVLDDEEPELDLRDRAPEVRSIGEREDEGAILASARSDASWSARGDDILPDREGGRNRSDTSSSENRPAAQPPLVAHFADEPSIELRPLEPAPVEGFLDDAPTGEVPPLPHWTEPPTGAMPAIFADDTETSDDPDDWPLSASAPRFRAEGNDWDDSDFSEDLSGEHVKLGALSNEGPIDEEAQFARDLAERRRGPRERATRLAPPRRPTRAPRAAPLADADLGARDPAAGRDLPTAIMTGLAVAVVAIVCFTRVWTTVALASLVVGAATLELASTLQKRGLRPATLVALVAATLTPIAAYNYGTKAYPVLFALVVIVSMLWFLWEITPGRPLPGVASTILVFAYVGGLGGFAGLLLSSPKHFGVRLLLGVALCVIAYDVFGYLVGRKFGHTAIAPRVSPNKTVEGTVAGVAAALIVGALIVGHINPWTMGRGALLGVLVAIGAFVGDLCESMFKRDLGVKDFGALLPGHGGVLDRFDSLLFCLPIAYYLALQFKIF